MKTDHIIIFARAPEPGRVKTRLCEVLTCEEAVQLYDAFVADTVEMAAGSGEYSVSIAYTPDDADGYFRDRFDGMGLEFFPQEGPDLGARMNRAFSHVFGRGAKRAVLIGTDIPALTRDVIDDAFAKLDGSDTVFGPAMDGGYYLVALNKPLDGIFEGMSWSTGHVMDDSLKRAAALGLSVSVVARLRDVDTPEDLAALRDADLPPHTREAVVRLMPRLTGL